MSSYEFHLVGDMTLRQFAKLAAGLAVAFVFYTLPLPSYFKWPLVLLFVFLGVALAFIPIQERPLEVWLISFLRAIYSPTEYVFRKMPTLPEFLAEEGPRPVSPPLTVSAFPKVSQKKLTEYLGGLASSPRTAWEEAEAKFFSQVKSAFAAIPTASRPPVSPPLPAGRQAPPLPAAQPPPVIPAFQPPQAPPVLQAAPVIPAAQPSPAIQTPSLPNIISGMLFDRQGKLLENAIIEIKDNAGYPVRALRSNKLGQFRSASPLENGPYQIEIEKEGLNFDIIKLELKGEAVTPLKIQAR